MKKLLLILSLIIFSSCSKEELIIEPEYDPSTFEIKGDWVFLQLPNGEPKWSLEDNIGSYITFLDVTGIRYQKRDVNYTMNGINYPVGSPIPWQHFDFEFNYPMLFMTTYGTHSSYSDNYVVKVYENGNVFKIIDSEGQFRRLYKRVNYDLDPVTATVNYIN